MDNCEKKKEKTMSKTYVGIDPGKLGFISILRDGNWSHISIKDNDMYTISDVFSMKDDIVCVMEDIHAIFGSSAKATFSFGETYGTLQGILIANKIPFHLIPPKTWQKEIWENKDMVVTYKKVTIKGKEVMRKDVNTKETSYNAARRLFPYMDFKRTERCKSYDDNLVDSVLLAEYARRKNL